MKIKLEEEEHNRLMMLNQEENARIAQLREERLKQQAKKVAERVLSSLLKKEEEKKIFEGKVESFLESQQVIIEFMGINFVSNNHSSLKI